MRRLLAAVLALAAIPAAAHAETLELVPAGGGPATTIADDGDRYLNGFWQLTWASDGGSLLAVADRGDASTLLRLPAVGGTPTPVRRLGGFENLPSPDGGRVAELHDSGFATRRGGVLVRDVATGRVTARLAQNLGGDELYEGGVGMTWSRDGSLLAVSAVEKSGPTLRIVEAATGRIVLRRRGAPGLSTQSFTPAGDRLAFSAPRNRAAILDLATGVVRRVGKRRADDVAWSPDGTRLALLEYDALSVVDPATGEGPTVPLSTSKESWDYGYGTLAWSPDGARIVYALSFELWSAGIRGSVMVADVAQGLGTPRPLVPRRRGTMSELRWSPAGDLLAFTFRRY